MATKTVSGGGNIKVTAYNPDERRVKYQQESDRALEELAQRRAALNSDRTYAAQYAQAINDYVNRGKFTYDFNSDPVYNQYKDSYTRQGKLAMKDTMGQAAALTGGYGNSYAQTAGQQVYNNYMQQLNDIVPTLSENAYSRYVQEGQDMLSKANALGDADAAEYERLLNDYNIASAEYQTAADLERNYAADALAREQLEYQKERDRVSDSQWEREFALSSGGSGSSGSTGSGTTGLYTWRGEETKDGEATGYMLFTDPDGKTVTVKKGINPYTGTRNKDADGGTFSNGYQPDNVGGKKLHETGYTDNIYGRTQNVYADTDGYCWYWNGADNTYEAYYKDGQWMKVNVSSQADNSNEKSSRKGGAAKYTSDNRLKY